MLQSLLLEIYDQNVYEQKNRPTFEYLGQTSSCIKELLLIRYCSYMIRCRIVLYTSEGDSNVHLTETMVYQMRLLDATDLPIWYIDLSIVSNFEILIYPN